MKIIGIVAEYNPYHNGHHYQIEHSKKILGADGVVAIMSGNFVQRGMPAFLDKWTRTKVALACGANLVIELPTFYATASAETFAHGAVSLLDASGAIDYLSFGSECDDLPSLASVANLLAFESPEFKAALSAQLKLGLSFPAARANALNHLADLPFDLNQANAILGIEYLKALMRLKSSIQPFLVKRIGKGYHDTSVDSCYSSATAIRQAFFSENNLDFSPFMPEKAAEILSESRHKCMSMEAFEQALLFLLRRFDAKTLASYRYVDEGLEHKIKNISGQVLTYDALVEALKSKRYPMTRINRLLLSVLLGIPKEIEGLPELGYLRILGMDETGQKIAKKMKANANIPLITNPNKAPRSLKENPLLALDFKATDLYALGTNQKKGGQDFTNGIVLQKNTP